MWQYSENVATVWQYSENVVTRCGNVQLEEQRRHDDGDGRHGHGGAGHPRLQYHPHGLEDARGQRDADHVVDEREREVDADPTDRHTWQVDGGHYVHQVVLQRKVGRFSEHDEHDSDVYHYCWSALIFSRFLFKERPLRAYDSTKRHPVISGKDTNQRRGFWLEIAENLFTGRPIWKFDIDWDIQQRAFITWFTRLVQYGLMATKASAQSGQTPTLTKNTHNLNTSNVLFMRTMAT